MSVRSVVVLSFLLTGLGANVVVSGKSVSSAGAFQELGACSHHS